MGDLAFRLGKGYFIFISICNRSTMPDVAGKRQSKMFNKSFHVNAGLL
jgi:hypothetical protein